MALIFLGGFLPLFLNGFYNGIIAQSAIFYWPVDLITWILVPCLLMYLYRIRGGKFRALGFIWPIFGFDIFKIFIYIAIWSFILLSAFKIGRSAGESLFDRNYLKTGFSYINLIPNTGFGGIAVWIYFSLTAGIVEEVFFRGLLRRFFAQNRMGAVFFVVTSTVLFSAIHWENGVNDMLATAAFGFGACVCYSLHGNILVPITAHFVADLFLFK